MFERADYSATDMITLLPYKLSMHICIVGIWQTNKAMYKYRNCSDRKQGSKEITLTISADFGLQRASRWPIVSDFARHNIVL
jgi:hypothetical protein